MEDLQYQIALTMIPKVGAVTARTLVSYCGGARGVFESSKKALLKIPGVGRQTAAAILGSKALQLAEGELRFIEQHDIQPLFYLDEKYPSRLRHYHNSPVMLYFKGNADLNSSRIVAVVGTRQPSMSGAALCEEIIEGLLPYHVLLISGLAFGIDITAHRKCLSRNRPTVGVLGHGLGQIYPQQHRAIALEMQENGGLLTEYPSGAGPEKDHFPMRNRIVAGLCDALIIVETGRKGGSMITAQFANDYNKDVFAVPGRPRDKHAEGCNFLIKTHRASLLEDAGDLAYIMRWEEEKKSISIQQQLFPELSEEEKIVVDLLLQNESLSVDRLTIETQWSNSRLAGLLLDLEFKGIVKALPGKRYLLV